MKYLCIKYFRYLKFYHTDLTIVTIVSVESRPPLCIGSSQRSPRINAEAKCQIQGSVFPLTIKIKQAIFKVLRVEQKSQEVKQIT